jgi:hypothetical protein
MFKKVKIYYVIGGILSIVGIYTLFVCIPNIYELLSNVHLFTVGTGHTKLNSTVLTNFLYLLLLICATFGLIQIKETRKTRMLSSLSTFFKFIYDETSIINKSKIRENRNKFESLQIPDDVNQAEIALKIFEKVIGGFESVSQILNLYNNVGLLVDREQLFVEDLPSIFPKNVIIYWTIFEKYINLRRFVDSDFEIEEGKIIRHAFYAEHFETLFRKCKDHLNKKYL